MECSLQCSWVHGIFLSKDTGVGCLFSCMGSSQPKNQTHVSCTDRQIFIHCATREVPNYIYFKNIAFICSRIVSLKAPIWGNESFLVSCSCRKNFESFLQRHWAYGWLAAPDISRFHPGNKTVLSEFSQGTEECLFLKAFSQWLLLLLLSRFSHVRLCATLWTVAYQAPPSMGFSRQEYWSGVPLPSPHRGWGWAFQPGDVSCYLH